MAGLPREISEKPYDDGIVLVMSHYNPSDVIGLQDFNSVPDV